MAALVIAISNKGEDQRESNQNVQNVNTVTEESKKDTETKNPVRVDYKIISREDVSSPGCKRVAIRLVVPDNSKKENVDYTLSKIISEEKSNWDDIIVWAWKYSEEDEVGKSMYTMGTDSFATCSGW